MKVLIVEDDIFISEHLELIVKRAGHQVLEICPDEGAFNDFISKDLPDVVLLDIRMNGNDEGIQVAKTLQNLDVPFVYVTSFSDKETLKNAVAMRPFGYIVKPFSVTEINDILSELSKYNDSRFLDINEIRKFERILINDIMWLKSDNVYVEIYSKDAKRVVRDKLDNLHERLPSELFVRTHRSYIVNLDFVTSGTLGGLKINEEDIPISRTNQKKIAQLIETKFS